jgi:hypothetical protein
MVYHNPFSVTGWMAQWPCLAGLEAELKELVGESAFETAWAEGLACCTGELLPAPTLSEVSTLLNPGIGR